MDLAQKVEARRLPPTAKRAAIRRVAGVTLREIAEELGVTPMTVLRWERGDAEPKQAHAVAYRELLRKLEAVSA